MQAAVLAAKRENPQRSVRQIRLLLEAAGVVARGTLSRCAVHRLLKAHGLSQIAGPAVVREEKRSFVAVRFPPKIVFQEVEVNSTKKETREC
ncbi:hypothetical protein [Burkholderia ubonensis]|uniref:hypothetical protein n=1 Tax=Burkholderia ubonensis TaxID=101571 RepID=UPI0018E0C8FA|nr:hypothetical protein [Burkholderia ubonensis]